MRLLAVLALSVSQKRLSRHTPGRETKLVKLGKNNAVKLAVKFLNYLAFLSIKKVAKLPLPQNVPMVLLNAVRLAGR